MKKVIKYTTFDGLAFDDEESALAWERAHYADDVASIYNKLDRVRGQINIFKDVFLPLIEKFCSDTSLITDSRVSALEWHMCSNECFKILSYTLKASLPKKLKNKLLKNAVCALRVSLIDEYHELRVKHQEIMQTWKTRYPGKSIDVEYKFIKSKEFWSSKVDM